MSEQELRDAVIRALTNVAPDSDPATIDPDADIAEQLDLDSMDFLNVIVVIAEQTGIEIPERDYGKLTTLDDLVAYLDKTQVPSRRVGAETPCSRDRCRSADPRGVGRDRSDRREPSSSEHPDGAHGGRNRSRGGGDRRAACTLGRSRSHGRSAGASRPSGSWAVPAGRW